MKTTIDDIKNEVIDVIGGSGERFGLNRTAAMLKALLWLTRRPLSLDEMADILEVSKASVSTNIRLLERWKVARRVYNRGDRKNYYEIRGDIWEIETEIARTVMRDFVDGLRNLFHRSSEDLKNVEQATAEDAEQVKFLNERFDQMLEYMDVVDHLMKALLKDGKVSPDTIKKISID